MNVDLILSWPRHCDYPLWRRWLAENRHDFQRVLIAFTEHHANLDLSLFVASELDGLAECYWMDRYWMGPPRSDWRDRAVNAMLELSTAKYVWFTEQDLIVHDHAPLRGALGAATKLDVWGTREAFGMLERERWHPACLLVSRRAIERTSKDFDCVYVDHFRRFTDELGEIVNLETLGVSFGPDGDVEHLAGLSQNHWLIHQRRYDELYEPARLERYLDACLHVRHADIALDPLWEAEVRAFLHARSMR